MKRFVIILTLVVSTFGVLFLNTAAAETMAEKYLGPPKMCLDSPRINNTTILNDQTILFTMQDGTFYLNRFPVRCVGLYIGNGFSYSTSIAKLCQQDSITALSTDGSSSSVCPIGAFFPFKFKGRTHDAVNLLQKKGLLKELVKEGAFKSQEAFPGK